MKNRYKIYLISSSTGGHAIPVLELQKALNRVTEFSVSVIHSGSEIEKELFNRTDSIIISSGKLHRFTSFSNIRELIKIFDAFIRSFFLLVFARPQLIFSKGGFNAVPLLFWAKILKIPFFIHESDSVMGLANKTFYSSSLKTFVSFPINTYHLNENKLDYSGMIIRDLICDRSSTNGRIKILITGGSQGSEAINKIIFDLLPRLLIKYDVLHHIGVNDIKKAKIISDNLPDELKGNYKYFTFSINEMTHAIYLASLVISRAGSTIGEIAKLKKASILIPYPYSASDHQMKNAKYLERVGGAILIKQDLLNADRLMKRIDFILSNKNNMEIIGNNAYMAIKTDGRDYIVSEIKKYFGVEK